MKLSADEQIEAEMRRQKIIERAVLAADRIIMDNTDGSLEETNFLTMSVALRFAEKAAIPYRSAILKKDLACEHTLPFA